MTEQSTYWAGKHKELVEALNARVPREGEVDRKQPALERFRKASNAYYDTYNNGCCNWQNRGKAMPALCKRYGMQTIRKSDMVVWGYRGTQYNDAGLARLEQLLDLVIIEAAQEQGLELPQRLQYIKQAKGM